MIRNSDTSGQASLAVVDSAEQADRPVEAESGATRILVEYTGPTALVLTGPITGVKYSFDQPGARLEVDVRDRQVILSVPVLRGVVGC